MIRDRLYDCPWCNRTFRSPGGRGRHLKRCSVIPDSERWPEPDCSIDEDLRRPNPTEGERLDLGFRMLDPEYGA